jgi:hypothetical protein
LLAVCSTALGQGTVTVTVIKYGIDPCTGGTESVHVLAPGQDKTIALCAMRANIVPSDSSVDIGRITFTGNPSIASFEIVLGGGSAGFGTEPTKVGRDWEGVNASAISNSVLYGGINGDLTGSIAVHQLMRFDAGGAMERGIQADEDWPGLFIVRAQSVGSTASIASTDGDIAQVDIAGDVESSIQAGGNIGQILIDGDMSGDILAPDGKITQVTIGGSLGASGTPIDITADTGLTSLEAD